MARLCSSALLVLVGSLLALSAQSASSARNPRVRWGQSNDKLFITFLLPATTPVTEDEVSVFFNNSHLAFNYRSDFEAVLQLREHILPDSSSWAVSRDGVRVVLLKQAPHLFDRLTVPNSYPSSLLSVDPLSPGAKVEDDGDEEDNSKESRPIAELRSAAELEALLATETVLAVVLDARYPWCRSGGTTRAQFAALAAEMAARPGWGEGGEVLFRKIDLRESPDLARALGYPPCEPRTHVDVVFREQPGGVPSYRVAMHSRGGVTPGVVLEELLRQPLTTLTCTEEHACLAAGAAAAAAQGAGRAALLVAGFSLHASQNNVLRAFAEAPGRRGTVRVLLAPEAPPPMSVRLFKGYDPDEPVAHGALQVLDSHEALTAFVDSRRVPVAAAYSWQLLSTLSAPGLPALKLFTGAQNNESGNTTTPALRDILVDACSQLRGVVVCAVYDATQHEFDVKQYGWDVHSDMPAIGLADDVQRLNAIRWAWSPNQGDDSAALVNWVRLALSGGVETAHPTERQSALDAAAAPPAPGVRRLAWTGLQREVLNATTTLAVLCLHSVFDETGSDPERPYALALAQLARVAQALSQHGTTSPPSRLLVAVMRSDRNYFPPHLFAMPATPGSVALFVVRGPRDQEPLRVRALGTASQRNAGGMLRALQRLAGDSDTSVDWHAALAALEERPAMRLDKDEL
jgi:CS domain